MPSGQTDMMTSLIFGSSQENGHITTDEHRAIADAADKFGNGQITMDNPPEYGNPGSSL